MGGGPAGASLAIRLARLGKRVAIVERDLEARGGTETLATGVEPLLELLGAREVLAGLPTVEVAELAWGGEVQRRDTDAWAVDRAQFDASMLALATAHADVRLYRPSRVIGTARDDDGWQLRLADGRVLRAALLADASGRRALLERRRLRTGAPTLAMAATWRGVDVDGMLVEAGSDAWYWAARRRDGDTDAIVFVQPGVTGKRSGYAALIARARVLAARLNAAHQVTDIRVRVATASVAACPATANSILVGDAALTIDPISSQGVLTAIGTAIHAGAVLNTLLERPEDTELALGFYRARVRESNDVHAAATSTLYRRQAAVDSHPFWRARVGPAPVASRPLALDAPISLASELAFGPVAVAGEHHVVRRDGVSRGGKDYAFVGRGIAIAPLLRDVVGATSMLGVIERWARYMPISEAARVFAWVHAEGLVV